MKNVFHYSEEYQRTMQRIDPCMLHVLPTDYLNNIHVCLIFQVYKKKTEAAKKEYLKALAAYRASLVSKV